MSAVPLRFLHVFEGKALLHPVARSTYKLRTREKGIAAAVAAAVAVTVALRKTGRDRNTKAASGSVRRQGGVGEPNKNVRRTQASTTSKETKAGRPSVDSGVTPNPPQAAPYAAE